MALPTGWKLLFSEHLYREEWLTVRREELQLPNGHIIPKYFVIEYPDWVNTIAITKDGKFVLVKQYRHALGQENYELCAGVVEGEGEPPLEAAKRELQEETGYTGGNWTEWMRIAPNPATSNNWVHCFIATNLEQGATSPEPSEDLSVHLHSYEEVKQMMLDGSIIQATHLAPLWKYASLHDGEATSFSTNVSCLFV